MPASSVWLERVYNTAPLISVIDNEIVFLSKRLNETWAFSEVGFGEIWTELVNARSSLTPETSYLVPDKATVYTLVLLLGNVEVTFIVALWTPKRVGLNEIFAWNFCPFGTI